MGRGRRGRMLVAVGVMLAVASCAALASSIVVRHTPSVHDAAPRLIEMEAVRGAIADELARAIGALYDPVALPAATLDGAAERMASNGYVIDDFQAALGDAHRRWLEGGALEVQLDAGVATQTALTAVRDVDPVAADQFPAGGVVTPGAVELPIEATMSRIADLESPALLAMLGGLVLIVLGAVIDRDRSHILKDIARGLSTAAVLCLLAAFVLPLTLLRDTTPAVGVLGALAAQNATVLGVAAAVLGVAGLSLHASADRLVAQVSRKVKTVREPKEAAPVGAGPKLSRRKAGRHRSEAIDAFFSERSTASGSASAPDEIVLDGDDGFGLLDEVDLPAATVGERNGESEDDGDDVAPEAELTPEQERAEALAAERKEALERIDGTRARYRTHLKR